MDYQAGDRGGGGGKRFKNRGESRRTFLWSRHGKREGREGAVVSCFRKKGTLLFVGFRRLGAQGGVRGEEPSENSTCRRVPGAETPRGEKFRGSGAQTTLGKKRSKRVKKKQGKKKVACQKARFRRGGGEEEHVTGEGRQEGHEKRKWDCNWLVIKKLEKKRRRRSVVGGGLNRESGEKGQKEERNWWS